MEDNFHRANNEYQKCLNTFYDRFFDGENVDLENACKDKFEELKKFPCFKKVSDEFQNYVKEKHEKI